MVLHRHVGIPLDVVNLWVFRHEVVNDAEHEVLYFGVAEVEDDLRATTSEGCVTLGSLDNPVRMCLVELTGGVGHLGLNPDTELHTVLTGIAQQTFNAFRQLTLIDYPVAQRGIIDGTRILVAKPSVVHHEELTAHGGDVGHHLVHALLVDVEIDALPRVEQNLTFCLPIGEHIFTTPAVEVTRDTAQSFL